MVSRVLRSGTVGLEFVDEIHTARARARLVDADFAEAPTRPLFPASIVLIPLVTLLYSFW